MHYSPKGWNLINKGDRLEEQTIASIADTTTRTCNTIDDLRLMLIEHILTQYDCYEVIGIRNIINETKTGAWRRPTLLKMQKMVFPAS